MSEKYNKCIMTIENNEIPLMMYGDAYMISQMCRGRLKGKEWKASVFFAIWCACMLYISIKHYDLLSNPVPTGISIICLYMMTYYLFILPKRMKLKGEHIYKSSHMLNKTETVTVTREGYVIENKYETLIGYWTDILDCIETGNYYLMISEYSKRLIIISKKCLDDEQNERLAEFLKRTMASKYRKTKK